MRFADFLRCEHVGEVERLDEFCTNDNVDFFVSYAGLSQWYQNLLAGLAYPERQLPSYNLGRSGQRRAYQEMFSEDDMRLMSERFSGEARLIAEVQTQGRLVP